MRDTLNWPFPPRPRVAPPLDHKSIESCIVLQVIHMPVDDPANPFCVVTLAEPGPDVAVEGSPMHTALCHCASEMFQAHGAALEGHPLSYLWGQVCVAGRWHRVYVACLAVAPADGKWQ